MLINKNYCDENTCVALRELGYNYPQRLIPDYFGVFEEPQYDEKIHLYDAQQWLREEKHIYVMVVAEYSKFGPITKVKYCLDVAHCKNDKFGHATTEWLDEECPDTVITFDSYEEALSEGIKEAVKILKEE